MLNELILLEFFTAQPTINFNKKKSILKEAIKLSNELALNFSRNKKIKKIHLLRNKYLKEIQNKKIITHSICKKNNVDKILKNFGYKTKLLLISPESKYENVRLHKKLNKKFTLLNSSLKNIEIFSSKLKTYEALKKKKIKTIKIEKELLENIQYISKPEFGTGSANIRIFKKKDKIKNQKTNIIQRYHKGEKGSFAMLCHDRKFQIISCNEQLLEFKNNKIYQVGSIIGGLESQKNEIYEIGKKICKHFPNLFGYIGVDIVKVKNEWRVIEVNPRFTSSYIGLEQAYGKRIINKINDFYINKKFDDKIYKLKKKLKFIFDEK